ncbi:hypothetical protein [Simplicispira suum]|jgi:hypothetical protein|uniref:Uncharacterized protein n=1 Tax=Simplicispira suum TaxID=2109915 RepID=A0A2S0N1H6_9BURK|nr:hypothetical protein [Simplicispira suum]AVO41811.1 hypothetical protein C6571_11415 [Simplicispira suum]MBW7832578.1 hypothetical protein [Simplicispira suum]
MLNLKLGLSALMLELGAWSGPLLLGGHTDSALASYLLVHAFACVLLALFAFPLVARRKAKPRLGILSLMAICSYAVPVAGFFGVLVAAIILRVYRRPSGQLDFDSLQMPEFDEHQRRQSNLRHAGLRSFLGNEHAPLQARLRAMVALQYVPGRTASPVLRNMLSDPNEDLRLLAYGMLDSLEKRINASIDAELQALQTARRDGKTDSAPQVIETLRRLSDLYWELVYQDLVLGDLRTHAVEQSLHYCERVLVHEQGSAQLHLRRGRLLQQQALDAQAAQAFETARALGIPASRLLPYEAELCFDRGDFARTRALMQEMRAWNSLPRLRPILDYWTAP